MYPGRRFLAVAVLCGAAFLSAGCSTVRFGYGQAERVAAWYAESYVTLDPQQSRLLGQQLAGFKQWHCSTQLGGYAAWLRQVGDEIQPGLGADRIEARIENLQYFAKMMAEQAAPRLAPLGRTMSDRQIAELKQSFDKGNQKYREQWVDAPADEIRAERAKRLKERVSYWVGSLDRRQQSMIDAWSRNLEMTGPDTLASRIRWQQELVRVLEARGDGVRLAEELRALLAEPDRFWTQRLVDHVERNRGLTVRLLAELANTLDDAQLKRVRTRTATLAADLEALACPQRRAVAELQ
jgi:hypothetical protein